MTSELEKALAAELRRAARHAPRHTPGFLEGIGTGRRRRRSGVALAAAAAVVALSAGGALGVHALDLNRGPAATGDPGGTRDPAATTGAPGFPDIAKVWPEAVHTVPRTLPNGRPFEPELFLDRRTLLVRTLNADRMDGLWAYDLEKRSARRLVAVTLPQGTTVTASFIAHGDGQLAWWTVHERRGKVIVDVWAAPASGGAQRKVTSFEGREGADLVIADWHVVWTPWRGTGVYRAPLSGGEPQRVPGAARFSLLAWPWAVNKGGDLLDLRDGSREKAGQPAGYQCAVTWCVKGDLAMRRDKSLMKNMPGLSSGNPPALDRFVVVQPPDRRGQVLYDLSANKLGDLGIRPDKQGAGQSVVPDHRNPGLLTYALEGRQVVVDLKAIK